jgi:hypothetical protein
MLRAGPAGKKSRKDSTISSVGIEFVDSIFEKDGQLENTEKFMASVCLWNLRIDASREHILRSSGVRLTASIRPTFGFVEIPEEDTEEVLRI